MPLDDALTGIEARARRAIAKAAGAFEEHEHPRDADGKFATKGTISAAEKYKNNMVTKMIAQARDRKDAKLLDETWRYYADKVKEGKDFGIVSREDLAYFADLAADHHRAVTGAYPSGYFNSEHFVKTGAVVAPLGTQGTLALNNPNTKTKSDLQRSTLLPPDPEQEATETFDPDDLPEDYGEADDPREIKAMLERDEAREVKLSNGEKVWVDPDREPPLVIDWDGKSDDATAEELESWMADQNVDDYYPSYEEEFNNEFWNHPPEVLFHGTDEDAAKVIIGGGGNDEPLHDLPETPGLDEDFTQDDYSEAQKLFDQYDSHELRQKGRAFMDQMNDAGEDTERGKRLSEIGDWYINAAHLAADNKERADAAERASEGAGLEARHEKPGSYNRDIDAAVFASRSTDTPSGYGSQIIEIDVKAMKRDGFTPRVTMEPAHKIAELRRAIADQLGIDDYTPDVEDVDDDPDTVIIFDSIPARYLSWDGRIGKARGERVLRNVRAKIKRDPAFLKRVADRSRASAALAKAKQWNPFTKKFEEAKHRRYPRGHPKGGQFADKPKGGDDPGPIPDFLKRPAASTAKPGAPSFEMPDDPNDIFGFDVAEHYAPYKGEQIVAPQYGYGFPAKKWTPPKGAKLHPRVDDKGKEVWVNYPSKPSDKSTWHNAAAVATFVPGGEAPKSLNGVPMKAWVPPADATGWASVEGQNFDLEEPHIETTTLSGVDQKGKPWSFVKKPASGVIIVEPDGRIWLTRPTNGYGGYFHTWPKGGVEAGLSPQANAIKEAFEETGLKVEITGILGDYERSTSSARFYIAKRVGGTPKLMGWESQAVRLVPPKNMKSLLNHKLDREIFDDWRAGRALRRIRKAIGQFEEAKHPRAHDGKFRSKGAMAAADHVDRLRRMKAQGYTIRAFHGTQGGKPIDQFHVGTHFGTAAAANQRIAELDDLASEALLPGQTQQRGHVYPVMLRVKKPVDLPDLGGWDREEVHQHLHRLGVISAAEKTRLDDGNEEGWEELLRSKGYDAVRYKNSNEDEGSTSFIMLDPDGARSIFAQFRGRGGIMKSYDPEQPRWPKGSPLGGQWMAMEGGIIAPPQIVGGKSNPQHQKAANAAFGLAKAGDWDSVKKMQADYAAKLAKIAEKAKTNTHDKAAAQIHQYLEALNGQKAAGPIVTAEALIKDGPPKLSSWTKIGAKPGGTAPGGIFKAPDGSLWLVKGYGLNNLGGDTKARMEVMANEFYKAAGVDVPDMKIIDLGAQFGGGVGVASRFIDEPIAKIDLSNAAEVAAAQKHYAANAWVNNYDAIGLVWDNTMIGENTGKAYMVDPGGSFSFKATQGAKPFTDEASLWDTQRDPNYNEKGATLYGSMTSADLAASASGVIAVKDETIRKIVEAHGEHLDPAQRKYLADKMIARRNDIASRASALPGASTLLPGAPNAKASALVTKKLDGSPIKVPGLTDFNSYKVAAAAVHLHEQGDLAALKGTLNALEQSPPQPDTPALKGFVGGLVALKEKTTVAAAAVTNSAMEMPPLPASIAAGSINGKKHDALVAMATKPGIDWKNDWVDVHNAAFDAKQSTGKSAASGKLFDDWMTYSLMKKHEAHEALGASVQGDLAALPKVSPADPIGGAAAPTLPSNIPPDSFIGEQHNKMAFLHLTAAGQSPKQLLSTYESIAAISQEKQFAHSGGAKLMYDWKVFAEGKIADVMNAHTPEEVFGEKVFNAPPVAASKIGIAIDAGGSPPPPALPDIHAKYGIPQTNTNFLSHKNKLDAIEKMAKDKNVKGIIALKFGTNTYAIKQVKAANEVLAAFGVSEKVSVGQLAGSHPSLAGDVAGTQAALASSALAEQSVKKVAFDPKKLPEPPNFHNWENTGKGLSGKAEYNQQNQDEVNAIFEVAKKGDIAALKAMNITSPSKHVKGYKDLLIGEIDDQLNPPEPLKVMHAGSALTMSEALATLGQKPAGTVISTLKKNEKVAYFAALGVIKTNHKWNDNESRPQTPAEVSATKAEHKTAFSNAARMGMGMSQDNALADYFRDGKMTASYSASNLVHQASFGVSGSHTINEIHQAMLKEAKPLKPNAKLYRYVNLPHGAVNQMLAMEPGTVLQDPSPMCTSYVNGATKSFGEHKIEFTTVPGARALPSFGSGSYSGEYEWTTVAGQRFVVLKVRKRPNGSLKIKALLLPLD